MALEIYHDQNNHLKEIIDLKNKIEKLEKEVKELKEFKKESQLEEFERIAERINKNSKKN